MLRFTYTFWNMRLGRKVTFGPYENETQAKEAFQRVYGHWPAYAVAVEVYV